MPSAKISSPIDTVQKKVEKSKKVEIQPKFVAPKKPGENQNASELANRMSGGYSGWSAPPTVFKEKSLLEIEEEKRKNVKHKKQAAPKQHDFPTLGKFYRGHNFYRWYQETIIGISGYGHL